MPENDQQGTGRHPHKSTEEPYPHHKSGSGEKENRGSESKESQGESQDTSSQDLKEREYRDNKGEVHHHTRTYEEQHK